ncbi:hypothetical protein J6590_107609, partial [Homalodisca vitripennis]
MDEVDNPGRAPNASSTSSSGLCINVTSDVNHDENRKVPKREQNSASTIRVP